MRPCSQISFYIERQERYRILYSFIIYAGTSSCSLLQGSSRAAWHKLRLYFSVATLKKKIQATHKLELSIMEPMLKGSQELPKSKLIKSSNVNSVEMVFCRCVICFCFLLFFLFCFVCLFFLCHQRVGVRFSVIPPQFERTLRQSQLWPQYIYLSIISLVLCTKGRTLWCYVTGSFFSYKSYYQKTAQQNRENS